MTGHDFYEVDLNNLDWNVNKSCEMFRQSGVGVGKGNTFKWVCLNHSKTKVAKLKFLGGN